MTGNTLNTLVIPEGLIVDMVYREYPENLFSSVSLKLKLLNLTSFG
jgi:hypothetical protein